MGFMDMPVGPQRKVAEEALEARLSKGKLHYWAFWRSLKSGANSAGRESPGTTGEPEQGVAPDLTTGGRG